MSQKPPAPVSDCRPIEVPGRGSPEWAYAPDCWGERGSDALGLSKTERIHGSSFAGKAEYQGDPLVYAFVSKASRLVWWTGTSGSLKESMPVLSDHQLEGKDTRDGSPPVREALADLWFLWREKSPTQAAALVDWVSKSILVSEALRLEMRDRENQFIDFDEDDALEEVPGELFLQSLSFREHSKDAVVSWFKANSWQYRETETGTVDDRPSVPADEVKKFDTKKWPKPEWFDDDDPILSLPPKENSTCLSLIEAITGQPLSDDTPRFSSHSGKKASYRDIGEFVSLAREYERVASAFTEARFSGEKMRGDELKQILSVMDMILLSIDAILLRFGSTVVRKNTTASKKPSSSKPARKMRSRKQDEAIEWPDFFSTSPGKYGSVSLYGKLVDARRAHNAPKKKDDDDSENVGRINFNKFVGLLLPTMFGEKVLKDPVVKALIAADDHSHLRSYDQLLRVDRSAGTIVHTETYAEEFALGVGTHSECVARRIGRQIYELYQTEARASKREDDLDRIITMMLSYRMPCSKKQEKQLRKYIPATEISRFGRQWIGTEAQLRKVYDERIRQDIQELLAEEQEDIEETTRAKADLPTYQKFDFLRKLSTMKEQGEATATPNASMRRFVMNPIDVLFHRSCCDMD